MPSHGLPQTLLDLTYAWTRTHRPALRTALVSGSKWRSLQTQALLRHPEAQNSLYSGESENGIGTHRNATFQIGHQVKPRSTAIGSLKERVDALLAQPIEEYGSLEAPVYSEEDLQNIYADLLAHPIPPTASPDGTAAVEEIDISEYPALLQNALSRLEIGTAEQPSETQSGSVLSDTLAKLRYGEVSVESGSSKLSTAPIVGEETPQYSKLLSWLQDSVANLEKARGVTLDALQDDTKDLPVKLLSSNEWKALMYTCIENHDYASCEQILDLAQRSKDDAFAPILELALTRFAFRGDVLATENLIKKYANGKPTELHIDMHIKALLRANHENPEEPEGSKIANTERALSVVHSYEAMSLFPAQRTYTRIISSFLHTRSSQCRAQAWDLFAHMRYVAHPKPDEKMYEVMIRSCASGGSSTHAATEPERAFDLWKEYTEDGRIPTSRTYNALILVCARSKKYASESFRLVKEMMDVHRDAFGNPLMRPDKYTLSALLEATKKTGDLARTRWILAEVINSFKRETDEATEKADIVNEEVMMHVFHAYATYCPAFQRAATKVIEYARAPDPDTPEISEEINPTQALEQPSPRRFTAIPPQTHAEVIAEADLLFERILAANGRLNHGREPSSEEISADAFSKVELSRRVVNSYVDVYYAHTSLHEAYALYKKVFDEAGVTRGGHTYLHALRRIAGRRKEDERETALSFANEVWNEWQVLEKGLGKYGQQARLIERVHAAMIKITAIYNETSRSVTILRDFFDNYNPRSVRIPKPQSPLRSARVQLYAHKPIIRLISPTEVPDDKVPPLLTFTDVSALHQRLVLEGREKDIKFLKYVCVSYECNLKKRRELSLKEK